MSDARLRTFYQTQPATVIRGAYSKDYKAIKHFLTGKFFFSKGH